MSVAQKYAEMLEAIGHHPVQMVDTPDLRALVEAALELEAVKRGDIVYAPPEPYLSPSFGPDGRLHVQVRSTTDAAREAEFEKTRERCIERIAKLKPAPDPSLPDDEKACAELHWEVLRSAEDAIRALEYEP